MKLRQPEQSHATAVALYGMKVQTVKTVQLLLYSCTQGLSCIYTSINNK